MGEALFFTNLMAPWNKIRGPLSRFTCETCHFEGYVDGRTHHTGRGDVRATTKPLLGLFNNRPHFSRALDPDLATMVNNEFRVAGAKSGHDPGSPPPRRPSRGRRSSTAPADDYDAIGLRRSLMAFLMDFTHRPNPAVLGRAVARPIASAAAPRSSRSAAARGATRRGSSPTTPGTRVPPAGWEALVLSREGPIVWASNGYKKTGIEPYVHEQGARPPSLRRLYKKWPYFTNGSAKSLGEVMGGCGGGARDVARRRAGGLSWGLCPTSAQGCEGLGEGDAEAVLAFLQLL